MLCLSVGFFTSCLCFVVSLLTLIQGIAYVILRLAGMDAEFESCGFFEADCNRGWRGIFSLRPSVVFDAWTPFALGVLGVSVHISFLRLCAFFAWILPTTYAQYAFFMALTALFGNVGYLGQCGIIIAILSGLAFLACVITSLLGESSVKMVQSKL